MSAPVVWEVQGGGEAGGIIVRTGVSVKSEAAAERLQTGALVEQLAVNSDRLHYKLLVGSGPQSGWVTLRLKDKELLVQSDRAKRKAQREVEVRQLATAAKGGEGKSFEDALAFVQAPPTPALAKALAKELQNQSRSAGGQPQDGWHSFLGLKSVANFRDAAGPWPGKRWKCHGGRLKRGLLFRTAHWNSASPQDMARIRDEFGILTYIDLRTGEHYEGLAAACYDDYPPCPSGRHEGLPERGPGQRRRIHCPFTKDHKFRAWTAEEKKGEVSSERALYSWWYQKALRDQKIQRNSAWRLAVTNWAILHLNSADVLKAAMILADRANYPVAYGCVAGKDRTGIFGMIILRALGVSEEDVLMDYLATNQCADHIGECVKVVFATPPQGGAAAKHKEASAVSQQNVIIKGEVFEGVARYTFSVLEDEFGGAANYLASIGFGAEQLERLREILVEEDS